jgi:hypothetical protein
MASEVGEVADLARRSRLSRRVGDSRTSSSIPRPFSNRSLTVRTPHSACSSPFRARLHALSGRRRECEQRQRHDDPTESAPDLPALCVCRPAVLPFYAYHGRKQWELRDAQAVRAPVVLEGAIAILAMPARARTMSLAFWDAGL